MQVDTRQANEGDVASLYDLYDLIGKKDAGYFEACFEKKCLILIASHEGKDIGFGMLNSNPKYNLYQKLGIPEIQDLNVIPQARQQGVATLIVEAFEVIACNQGAENIGISVGLTKDYGPAQRLYCKLGYMPDGYGAAYNREGLTFGQSYLADDDLCLMLVKSLHAQ